MASTEIEWCDKVWNPVRGCSRVSSGCDNCYAMGQAHRFSGAGKPYEGLTTIRRGKVDWAGMARLVPEQLAAPLSWRKPQRIFVNSMSDLFHESLSNEEIAAVFGVMAACPQHTFQVLTKRPKRMAEWFKWLSVEFENMERDIGERVPVGSSREGAGCVSIAVNHILPGHCVSDVQSTLEMYDHCDSSPWPLPNVWLGVSVEDQRTADERIPLLLQCPAAVRFVSAEPLLGALDLSPYFEPTSAPYCMNCGRAEVRFIGGNDFEWSEHGDLLCPECGHSSGAESMQLEGLDWVIVGGESGHGARPCDVEWIRSIVEQCKAAGVACFVKQLGDKPVTQHPMGAQGELVAIQMATRKGADMSEWPEDLHVRQMPGGGS